MKDEEDEQEEQEHKEEEVDEEEKEGDKDEDPIALPAEVSVKKQTDGGLGKTKDVGVGPNLPMVHVFEFQVTP